MRRDVRDEGLETRRRRMRDAGCGVGGMKEKEMGNEN